MISVKLPDGSTAQFPDGTSRETMTAAIQKKFPPQGHGAPGSRAYADWAAQQARAGQPLPQVSQIPQRAPDMGQQVMNSIGATANGIVNGIPVLGPLAQGATDVLGGGISQLTGGNYEDYIKRQQALRQQYAEQAPVASVLGNIAGGAAAFGGLGSLGAADSFAFDKAGQVIPKLIAPASDALGITGTKILPRVVNGLLSTEAIGTADNMARGQKPTDAMIGAVLPAVAGGAGGPLIGKAIEGIGGAVAGKFTQAAQQKLTDAAIKGAPTAAALKKTYGDMIEAGTSDKTAPILKPEAFNTFLSNVQDLTKRYRPNELNNPEAAGLFRKMSEIATDVNDPTSNVVVDLKDLHLLRQEANDVANGNASDTTKSVAGKIIDTIDSTVANLKPSDVIAGDPREAANNLLKGISGYNRAVKTGVIENAVTKAATYKSTLSDNLKTSFSALMRSKDFSRFSTAEKDAIRTVAKGTSLQNFASLFGKLGFSLTGTSAHNIIGGGLGTSVVASALTPFVGPFAAVPAALGITTAAGSSGRALANSIGEGAANRAARVAATPNIPTAIPVPNMLNGVSKPIELLIRGGAQGMTR